MKSEANRNHSVLAGAAVAAGAAVGAGVSVLAGSAFCPQPAMPSSRMAASRSEMSFVLFMIRFSFLKLLLLDVVIAVMP